MVYTKWSNLGPAFFIHLSWYSINVLSHTEERVPGFLSSRLNWVPPLPHPQGIVARLAPPLFVSKGRHTRWWGGGCGGPNSDEGINTLILYVYYNPSTDSTPPPFQSYIFLSLYYCSLPPASKYSGTRIGRQEKSLVIFTFIVLCIIPVTVNRSITKIKWDSL
jgi:hypothetical protein